MSEPPCNSRSGDVRLDELIADYMQRIDRGETVDRERFLAEHPDLVAELRAFFETDDQVERLASPALDSAPTDRNAATLPPSSLVGGAPATSDATPPDHSPLTTHHSLPTLRYFGDYELLSEIARGGMGVVYKARQVSLNRIVAVKMILAGQLAGPDDVKRFRNEAEAAAQLQHPNIVAIHEVGEHEGQHYFSMDFIGGTSLAALVRENPLPAKQAAAIVKTVAEAIHYAHTKGILHRDLKPSNVLMQKSEIRSTKSETNPNERKGKSQTAALGVSDIAASGFEILSDFGFRGSDFVPKVTDFGLAKRIEGGSELTGTGQILGTPSYMPPEQAGASRGEIGPASDVYSLGAILYELVTGRPPFRAETPLDTLLQVLERDAAPPRLLNPNVDRDLETMCLKCLDKDPSQRYVSAQALADDLSRWLADEPITARSLNLLDRVARALGRSKEDVQLQHWGGILYAFAALVFLAEVAIYVHALGGPPYPIHEGLGIRAIQFSLMGLVLWRQRRHWSFSKTAAERQMWSIWIGYLISCNLAVQAVILTTEPGRPAEILNGYPMLAILSGLVFFVLGANYWGKSYTIGVAFFVLAMLMPLKLKWAPLEFGILWATCLLMIGSRLRRLAEQAQR